MRTLWVAAVLLVGCVRTESERCDDGSLCSRDRQCVALSTGDFYCALPEELLACANLVNGDACGDGLSNQYCRDQLCVAGVCGDGVTSGTEACDTAGDTTCAATCLSHLECGNGIRDPGENCDDGNAIAGDGCNTACNFESPRWSQLSSSVPPPRSAHAMAYDARRDRTILFGGELLATGEEDGATWERDASGYWTERPIQIAPPPRQRHGMAFDSERDRTVLFGGTLDGLSPVDDLWEWDGQEWTAPLAPNGPPPRARFMMAYDPIRKVTVIVGGVLDGIRGEDSAMFATDAWSWDGSTWTELPSPSPTIGRCCGAMTFDPVRGEIVMTGGQIEVSDGTGFELFPSQDTFTFDGATWTTHPAGAFPDGRTYQPVLAFDPERSAVVAVSGQSDLGVADGSGTTYRLDATAWFELVGLVTPPRVGAALTPTRDGLMLVGGAVGSDAGAILFRTERDWSRQVAPNFERLVYPYRFASNIVHGRTIGLTYDRVDFYTLDATAIERLPYQGASLADAIDVGVAYDEVRDELVVVRFPPFTDPMPTATTYRGRIDATAERIWTLTAVPTPGPSTRRGAGVIYDPARARIVMFGGVIPGVTSPTDETWIFDGATWSELTVTERPPARNDFPIAYDRRTAEVVIHGGSGRDGSPIADTWSLGATGWRRRDATDASAPRPLPRSVPNLAYDLDRERVVLVGGSLAGSPLADSWELDDAGWVRVFADDAPGGITEALVTAPDGRGVLKIGASNLSRLTWVSDLPVDACLALDSDGDGAAGCDDDDCWHVCSPLCRPDLDTVCTESPSCGDGLPNGVETCQTCPQDALACNVCGDFVCDGIESPATCPGDCI